MAMQRPASLTGQHSRLRLIILVCAPISFNLLFTQFATTHCEFDWKESQLPPVYEQVIPDTPVRNRGAKRGRQDGGGSNAIATLVQPLEFTQQRQAHGHRVVAVDSGDEDDWRVVA